MLILKVDDSQKIVINTPSGDIEVIVFTKHRVGVNAPKAFKITKAIDQGRTNAQEITTDSQ